MPSSDRAIAQAFREFGNKSARSEPATSTGAVAWITHRAAELDAQQQPADAPQHGGRPMTLRECMEAEEPQQPADGGQREGLYHAVNQLMRKIGESGEASSRDAEVAAVMDELAAIDGGRYTAANVPSGLPELPVIAWTDGNSAWLAPGCEVTGTTALVNKDDAIAYGEQCRADLLEELDNLRAQVAAMESVQSDALDRAADRIAGGRAVVDAWMIERAAWAVKRVFDARKEGAHVDYVEVANAALTDALGGREGS